MGGFRSITMKLAIACQLACVFLAAAAKGYPTEDQWSESTHDAGTQELAAKKMHLARPELKTVAAFDSLQCLLDRNPDWKGYDCKGYTAFCNDKTWGPDMQECCEECAKKGPGVKAPSTTPLAGPFAGMSLKEMQAALAAMTSNGEKDAALASLSPEERAALFKAVGAPPKNDPKSCYNSCQENGGSGTECVCSCIPEEKDSPKCGGKSDSEGQPPKEGEGAKAPSKGGGKKPLIKPSNQNLSCDIPADQNMDMSPVTGLCDGGCLIQYDDHTRCYYRGDENAEVACGDSDMLWCPTVVRQLKTLRSEATDMNSN